MRFERVKDPVGELVNSDIRVSRWQQALLLAALLLPVSLLWGCSGIVSGQSTRATSLPTTYSISGTISPVAGGSGATVTLNGAANATTIADSSGNFTYSGLANGTYTITPSHPGFTFSPSSATVTINGANVTSGTNFTAAAQTFSISGTIGPVAGGSGTTVTVSGAANATTTADSSGNFTFGGLVSGTYTVTPSRSGYTFSPASLNATINGANVTSVNFTATAQVGQTYSISGTITPVAGGSGATVTLGGAAAATTTANGSGNYTFTGLSNGTYAVTPSNTGYTFNPNIQTATINGANLTGVNFTATPQVSQTYSISGTITPVTGGSGSTVTLSGAGSATTVANSTGNYSFTGLSNGSYTVTPSNTGFTFSPVNLGVPVNGSNVSNVNFTATAQQSHTVALTWNASTSTVTGYNVYRSTVSGTAYTRINPSLVGVLVYNDAAVLNGTTYFYVTTAVDASGGESTYSNEVSAVIP